MERGNVNSQGKYLDNRIEISATKGGGGAKKPLGNGDSVLSGKVPTLRRQRVCPTPALPTLSASESMAAPKLSSPSATPSALISESSISHRNLATQVLPTPCMSRRAQSPAHVTSEVAAVVHTVSLGR